VPSGSAARKIDPSQLLDEGYASGPAPGSEQAQYQPRYRVVTRKPMVQARRRPKVSPLQRGLALAIIPAICLLVYVMFWTLAMRGGYYRNQLQAQIADLRTEQQELEAEKRRREAPSFILESAAKLGMTPAQQREFGVPSAAQATGSRSSTD